jgi:hypothetical protein
VAKAPQNHNGPSDRHRFPSVITDYEDSRGADRRDDQRPQDRRPQSTERPSIQAPTSGPIDIKKVAKNSHLHRVSVI